MKRALQRIAAPFVLAAAAAPASASPPAGDLSLGAGVSLAGAHPSAHAGGGKGGIRMRFGSGHGKWSRYSKGSGHGWNGLHGSRRAYVPAGYHVVHETVWVPGTTRRVWIDPLVETRFDSCGRPYTVVVVPGHYETVHEPGHYETVARKVWRPGHWAY